MPALIASVLLAYFGAALFLPAFFPTLKIETNLIQTLINLVIAVVSFYVGTTQQSAKKDETIATLKGKP